MQNEKGFTLIEIVASLAIVGIIAVFSSLFLVVGLEGYEFTRKAANAAMNAEVALNRISLELKAITGISALTSTSVTYTSAYDTAALNRILYFDSGNLYLNTGGVDNYLLLKDVSNPVLTKKDDTDLDGDGTNEVSYVTVGFTLSDMPAFQVRVYPREMIDAP